MCNRGNLNIATPIHKVVAVVRNAEVVIILEFEHLKTAINGFNAKLLYLVSASMISHVLQENSAPSFWGI
jgi:hypothetical protein